MSNVRLQACFIQTTDGTNYPGVLPGNLNPGASEFQLDDSRRREVGVSVYDSGSGDLCWVMRQGYLRNVDFGTGVSTGTIIWAGDSGEPGLTRPGPTKTRVKLGVVYRGNSSYTVDESTFWNADAHVFVDVRVYPPLGEFSGVDTESTAPTLREVLTVVDHGSGVLGWKNKPIRRSADYAFDFNVQVDEYLARVDASAGDVVATLPPVATSADVVVNIKKIDSSGNVVTIDGDGSDMIDDSLTFDLVLQGESLQLQCDGIQWSVI